MLEALAARGVNELHVEAGAKLNGALLDAGLVDEVLLYVAPALLGDPARGMFERAAPLAALGARTEFAWHDVQRVGADVRIVARRVARGWLRHERQGEHAPSFPRKREPSVVRAAAEGTSTPLGPRVRGDDGGHWARCPSR